MPNLLPCLYQYHYRSRMPPAGLLMKVEVICTETIKPSTPTPKNLRKLNLSLCDQLTPAIYIPLLLYYSSVSAAIVRRLKSSLAVLLTQFYPLAGRIRDNHYVECNDEGVDFIEVKVRGSMSEFLVSPQPHAMKRLLPIDMALEEAGVGRLLVVQGNSFEYGGFALGICMSHKIADASTFCNFITCWGKLTCDIAKIIVPPVLDASTLIPPCTHLAGMTPVELPRDKTVTSRCVLDSSKITALVTRITSKDIASSPTRVEAVSALLWRCLSKGSKNLGLGSRSSVFSQAVNLRPRMLPQLPDNTFGNLVGSISVEMKVDEVAEIDLSELAMKMREKKNNYLENYVRKGLVGDNIQVSILAFTKAFGELITSEDVDFYNCSSWCKFPLYEVDFGWGRPIWVSEVGMEFKNSITMMDGIGGDGIEIWLTLMADHMKELEKDEELREFVSFNPSIMQTLY